jgi:hypothetical protein
LGQGSLVFWLTAEAIGDSKARYYFMIPGGKLYVNIISTNTLRFNFYDGSTTRILSTDVSGWTPGTLYNIVYRWDTRNTLDGSNHVCVSVNDVHTFGVGTFVEATNDSNQPWRIGSYTSANIADAILEGYTVYRRPLFDGTYGIDVNGVDEINEIWAAGAGKDPCLITGSWDICFCLPTNSTVGEIVTGTGHAWSHPHSSNILGAGGFMMDGTYTNDGWADEGTPTAVAALATAEKIFTGGYKVTSDAANEGIYKDYTCTPDQDFVIRVIAHSDGTSVPKAILHDQTNTAEIGSLTGTNGSTRTAPDIIIFTGRAPAGCTTLRVKLINTDATASDITCWHQCELLANKIQNPGMDTGAGDPWIPTGWTNSSLDAGDTEAEAGTVHSGASCIQFNAGATDSDGLRNGHDSVANGSFACLGIWRYGNGSNGVKVGVEGSQWRNHYSESVTWNIPIPTTAAWIHSFAVMRRTGVGGGTVFLYGQSDGPLYADDIYLVQLDNISLNVTPASEAACAENGGLRVAGRSSCLRDITGKLGATSGSVRFKWTPRHGTGIFEKFWESTAVYMCQIHLNSSNRIAVYSKNDTQLVLLCEVGGTLASASFSPGTIVAGTEYSIEIKYDPTYCRFLIGGVQRKTVEPAGGINFGANIPDTFYAGASNAQIKQNDAVYSAP